MASRAPAPSHGGARPAGRRLCLGPATAGASERDRGAARGSGDACRRHDAGGDRGRTRSPASRAGGGGAAGDRPGAGARPAMDRPGAGGDRDGGPAARSAAIARGHRPQPRGAGTLGHAGGSGRGLGGDRRQSGLDRLGGAPRLLHHAGRRVPAHRRHSGLAGGRHLQRESHPRARAPRHARLGFRLGAGAQGLAGRWRDR